MRAIWLLFTGLLTVGCSSEEAGFFFEDVPFPARPPEHKEEARLEFVREWGDRERGLVFGRIADIAIGAGGVLAVADASSCQVWLVDTQSNRHSVIGGCGEGPGEFRSISSVAFHGDTLLAFDEGRMSLVRLSLEGAELGRLQLPVFGFGAVRISDLYVGGEGLVVAGLDLLPNPSWEMLPNAAELPHLQIRAFDGHGAELGFRHLAAPPIARATRENIVRYGSMCGTSSEALGELVVAVNMWGPQVLILRGTDLRPLFSVRVPVDWARSVEYPEGSGNWAPIGPLPGVACGEKHAIVGYRFQEALTDGGTRIHRAAAVLISLAADSLSVIGADEAPEPGSALLMTPGAAVGNRFFFFSNGLLGYPVVREYRITVGGAS